MNALRNFLRAFFVPVRNKILWQHRGGLEKFKDYLWASWAYFRGQILVQEKYWPSNIRGLLKKQPLRRVRILMRWWGVPNSVFEAHVANAMGEHGSRIGLILALTEVLGGQHEFAQALLTSGLPCLDFPQRARRIARFLPLVYPNSPIPEKLREREWRSQRLQQRFSRQKIR